MRRAGTLRGIILALSVATALATAGACNPASRLTLDEQVWCATHPEEVARIKEEARAVGAILEGPLERRPMTEDEAACSFAYVQAHLD
jgi:hypothetical protein